MRDLRDLDRYRWNGGEQRLRINPDRSGYGLFLIVRKGVTLRTLASTGEGWDHVSVCTANRRPSWERWSTSSGCSFERMKRRCNCIRHSRTTGTVTHTACTSGAHTSKASRCRIRCWWLRRKRWCRRDARLAGCTAPPLHVLQRGSRPSDHRCSLSRRALRGRPDTQRTRVFGCWRHDALRSAAPGSRLAGDLLGDPARRLEKTMNAARCCATCGAHFRPIDASHAHCGTCVRGHVVVSAFRLADIASRNDQPLPVSEIRSIAESIVRVTSQTQLQPEVRAATANASRHPLGRAPITTTSRAERH